MDRSRRIAFVLLAGLILVGSLIISFALYSSFRTMGVSIGFSLRDSLFIAGVSMGMTTAFASIPVSIFLVVISWQDLVRLRRIRRGLCAACGYSREGVAIPKCPECGCETKPEDVAKSKSFRRVPLFIAALAGATFLGSAVAEAWIVNDEHRFRGEARAWEASGGTGYFHRGRLWPNGSSELIYHAEYGFRAND